MDGSSVRKEKCTVLYCKYGYVYRITGLPARRLPTLTAQPYSPSPPTKCSSSSPSTRHFDIFNQHVLNLLHHVEGVRTTSSGDRSSRSSGPILVIPFSSLSCTFAHSASAPSIRPHRGTVRPKHQAAVARRHRAHTVIKGRTEGKAGAIAAVRQRSQTERARTTLVTDAA
jgi:hypothetical protein